MPGALSARVRASLLRNFAAQCCNHQTSNHSKILPSQGVVSHVVPPSKLARTLTVAALCAYSRRPPNCCVQLPAFLESLQVTLCLATLPPSRERCDLAQTGCRSVGILLPRPFYTQWRRVIWTLVNQVGVSFGRLTWQACDPDSRDTKRSVTMRR